MEEKDVEMVDSLRFISTNDVLVYPHFQIRIVIKMD